MGEAKRRGTYEERKAAAIKEAAHTRSEQAKVPARAPSVRGAATIALAAGLAGIILIKEKDHD